MWESLSEIFSWTARGSLYAVGVNCHHRPGADFIAPGAVGAVELRVVDDSAGAPGDPCGAGMGDEPVESGAE